MVPIFAFNTFVSLVLTETKSSGNDNAPRYDVWLNKFGDMIGMDLTRWSWKRGEKAWHISYVQVLNDAQPQAEIVMVFEETATGYMLTRLEYRPLFWMSPAFQKLEKYRRHIVDFTMYPRDSNKDIQQAISEAVSRCHDDLSVRGRLNLFLQEIDAGTPVKADAESMTWNITDDAKAKAIKQLRQFGWNVSAKGPAYTISK